MARKDVTPAEIEAAYQDLKARYPIVSKADQLAATRRAPRLGLRGWSGWLCKVCRRVPLPNRSRGPGTAVRPAALSISARPDAFGGKRILPLGQHSIMNGIGIRLATPEGPGLTAKFEQFVALGRGWQDIDAWAEIEGERLVAEAEGSGSRLAESVPLPTWQEWFPPSREASADAFARLIALQQPWLIDMEPKVGDVAWLAGARR